MHEHHFKIGKVEKLPDSEAQITGEISLPFLVQMRKEALKHLGSHADIPGFRPGHIPEEVLVKHVGEMRVLEEAAELALSHQYSHIVEEALGHSSTGEAKLSPIGRPDVSITKLAPGIPLEFKIKVSVEPEFELPEYKKLVKEISSIKEEEIKVEEKEVSDTLAELKKREIKPELAEGEKLEDKIRESILAQKKLQAQEKRRLSIIEKLVKETDIVVPKALIEAEQSKMLAQFRADVEGMGVKWDEYLTRAGKSEADIKEEWKTQARDRVKAELIVSKIAYIEKLEPAEGELEHEVEHVLSHYPDANPLNVRFFVYTQLRNQRVMEFLETQA